MSIRAKLLIPLLLLAASVLAAMHFIAFASLKRTLVAERMNGEQHGLEMLAQAIAPDLLAFDLAKIHETLGGVQGRYPWWQSLILTDANGRRLYPLAATGALPGMILLRAPVTVAGRDLGALVVEMDGDVLVAPALAVVQRLELVVGLILILGTVAVVGMQSHSVVRPLVSLAEASRLLSEGRYDVALPSPSRDEVGGLVLAFRSMCGAVSSREAALRRSERRRAAIMDNSAEAVIGVDSQGCILSFNKAAEGMFRLSSDRALGMSADALVCLDGLVDVGGVEVEACRTDGRVFPAFVTASRVAEEDWNMVVVTIADLTLRKEAEALLRESEGRFRDLAESASDWFWEADTDYRLTFVSERIGAILGVKPSAILGYSYFDVGLGDGDPELARRHAEDLAAHHPFRDLVFSIGPEGGKDGKIVRISGMPFYDQTGAFIGYRGVGADITREARAEKRAHQAQQRYQLILDCAGDGIVGLSSDGTVSFANRMAAALLEHAPDDMIGQSFADLVMAADADRAILREACRDGVAEQVADAVFHRGASSPLPVEYLAASLIEEEATVGAVLVFRDVTMRRQYERALADQHAELERLVDERTKELERAQGEALSASRLASVGQLAAGIAHEINTPIQYIGDNLAFIQGATAEMIPLLGEARKLAADLEQGQAFLARFDPANLDFLMEETPAAIAQSLEGVAQVARIVLSMKEFSHPGTSIKSEVDLNRALETTITVSRNTWKHVALLETKLDPALPLVNCHPGEMNQVFLNLIVNAAHAIEASGKPYPGTITVETMAGGGFVEIRVSDSGTGVPEDIKNRIFDPFFTTKDVGKGTGQGLAICYDVVVTKHGGEILVGGAPGEGAVFTVRLPLMDTTSR